MNRPVDPWQLKGVIDERGPLPLCELALAVHRRKTDVLRALRAGPFVRVGRTKASRWDNASFDVREAAEHFGISLELAEEYLYGESGFIELGLVTNGDGLFRVTDPGIEFSLDVQSWLGPPESARLPALPLPSARGGVPRDIKEES